MKNLLVVLLQALAINALAQSSSRFSITRGVIASGGTTFSSSARFQLGSTISQPLAAVPASSRFSIQGGFWIWPAPMIYPPAQIGTNFVFAFQTEPGSTYTVQYAICLPASNWQNLTTLIGDGGVNTLTNPAPGWPQQFFRLIER